MVLGNFAGSFHIFVIRGLARDSEIQEGSVLKAKVEMFKKFLETRTEAEEMSHFSVKIYHQGMFRLQGGTVRYLGGETSIVDYCDEDEWSLIEVYEIVSRQGYLKKDIAAMWYKTANAGLEDGLTMLKTDKDAMDMARIGVKDDMVEVYVVHKTSEVGEVVQPGQLTAPAEEGDQAGPGPIVVYDGPGVGSKAATDGPIDRPNDGPTEVEEVGSMSEGSCEVVKSDDAVEEEEEEGSETSEDDDYDPGGVKAHRLLIRLLGMHQLTALVVLILVTVMMRGRELKA
ncbi:uncharacterized protein [Arachis hypogaea]|uniref:uncharacterized protein isoform X1 n=3 Tax=Arachis hypogaea TaxID=3818 RepID=UPI003B21DF1D